MDISVVSWLARGLILGFAIAAPVGPIVGEVDPCVPAHALGEAAGPDRRRRKLLAGRLVPREAAHALPARHVVDERDAAAVLELGDDLVP